MIPAMIVPILTRPELLYAMIETIDVDVSDLVIIDNGADVDKDRIPYDHLERVHVLRMPYNFGVAGSWNLGIKSLPFAPWWLIANFDVTWPPGSLQQFVDMQHPNKLVLSGGGPVWCAFAIGEDVVDLVGLFDEGFHPGYFEDNDYQRRCDHHGIPVIYSGIPVQHQNSSTLKAGFDRLNGYTFAQNQMHLHDKAFNGDYSEGRWTLARRRRLSWD